MEEGWLFYNKTPTELRTATFNFRSVTANKYICTTKVFYYLFAVSRSWFWEIIINE